MLSAAIDVRVAAFLRPDALTWLARVVGSNYDASSSDSNEFNMVFFSLIDGVVNKLSSTSYCLLVCLGVTWSKTAADSELCACCWLAAATLDMLSGGLGTLLACYADDALLWLLALS